MREIEQDKEDGRIFYDTDGNPRTLYQLVRQEPDWAVSRLEYYMGFHDDLIAAAPDLLGALELLCDAPNRLHSDGRAELLTHVDILDKAEQAIAKARGNK